MEGLDKKKKEQINMHFQDLTTHIRIRDELRAFILEIHVYATPKIWEWQRS